MDERFFFYKNHNSVVEIFMGNRVTFWNSKQINKKRFQGEHMRNRVGKTGYCIKKQKKNT